ncbi:uncharacterized protein MONBRDRAFT_38306 [Monosiga brevicollis MX1]|uniref:SAM-dependent MTase RsmB/NOP-type domain-containing protein n=1 Tax=Monosiga brevicollis TaxID=81824 RepID=A9V6W9_MONBE|nr:uncharacterized protein MONBRDRAFT_38306 [Monosiga brevicollis MX1]EDQ86689.1 predicted protein [Monosiga brevicollis MX1]|eukprot:XP_001748525.1 hypothetical protein [Monosiga brevicollis MX1]
MPKRQGRSRRLVQLAKRRKEAAEGEVAPEALRVSDPPEILRGEPCFVEYYLQQGLLDDREWSAFMRALRQPLPVTFRINKASARPELLQPCLEQIEALIQDPSNELQANAPRALGWIDAWQLGCASQSLKFATEPAMQRLRQWLAEFTALGVLSRQEVVSMLPVAFLNIEPHHRVLDMCASPGSKTTQALEALHAQGNASGFVMANDVDAKRAYILVRRLAPLGPACQKLVVTQHKAQKYPSLSHEREDRYLRGSFDRIICDVPCCGDGTLRKSPDMWRRWHPGFAIGLHTLQLQIAMRGLSLLRPGGIMVYSTCTFNPLEDEAVVAALLQKCGGAVELVDCSGRHPDLARRPGVYSWKVYDDDMREFPDFAATQHDSVSPNTRKIMRPTMFPPSPDVAESLCLERCMRFYPHLQDTGGFFVAVLRKTKPLPGPPSPIADADPAQSGPLRELEPPHQPASLAHVPARDSSSLALLVKEGAACVARFAGRNVLSIKRKPLKMLLANVNAWMPLAKLDLSTRRLNKFSTGTLPRSLAGLYLEGSLEQLPLADILCHGYLYKKGAKNPAWKRRYCTLDRNGILRYYKHETDEAPQGFINLHDLINTELVVTGTFNRKRRFPFDIVTTTRVWHMAAETSGDLRRWRRTLDEQIPVLSEERWVQEAESIICQAEYERLAKDPLDRDILAMSMELLEQSEAQGTTPGWSLPCDAGIGATAPMPVKPQHDHGRRTTLRQIARSASRLLGSSPSDVSRRFSRSRWYSSSVGEEDSSSSESSDDGISVDSGIPRTAPV